MGLRHAFAGAAIGGFLGALTQTPGLGQVGAAVGLMSGGHTSRGERFVDNHPRWADNHPRAAHIIENSGPFGSIAGERFVQNHPVWAARHPYAADRMDLGGPSFSRNLYPGIGIAAMGGSALGGIFNSFAQGIGNAAFSSPGPSADFDQPSVAHRGGPSFGGGFNNA